MENLRREVLLYVHRLCEERLGDDLDRRTRFRNLVLYFRDNRDHSYSYRNELIRYFFGEQNEDVAQVYFAIVQDQYEESLRQRPLAEQTTRLVKLARMCYCIQFMDLYRERFPIPSAAYTILCNVVTQFHADRISESQLSVHFGQVLLQFPDFRNELEARVNRLTPLFRDGYGGGPGNNAGAGNNPGAGNPPPGPPQV